MKPLSKRDLHAAIAAFSFCSRAVIFENGGAVLSFPRLLSRELIIKTSKFFLKVYFYISRGINFQDIPPKSGGFMVIDEDISLKP